MLRGLVALNRGRYPQAIAALQRFVTQTDCATCAAAWLARAWDQAGQPDSAVAFFEQLVSRPSYAVRYDAGQLAHGYRRLAEIYEDRGARDRAADYYARLADLWSKADPPFQPVVQAARAALAGLAAEPSTP